MSWSRLPGAIARRLRREAAAPSPSVAPPREWKQSLRLFFAQRAASIETVPSLEDLCWISGRDPRLWTDPARVADLARSIVEQAGMTPSANVLEIGCASGFLARAVAPLVGRYTGVDLAEDALRVAERLGLPNARFEAADGARLSFADGAFDAAFCYDVFTNFPTFQAGESLIEELVRVVRPGGRALMGSIPDAAKRSASGTRAVEISRALDAELGPLPERSEAARHVVAGVAPGIVCYDFAAAEFVALGRRLRVRCEIRDIHPMNPYAGLRFNVIYHKPAA